MNISFTHPDYLLLLVFIPLIIFAHFATLRFRRMHALKFANFDAIARVKGIDLYSKNVFVLILTMLILCLVVFSLAGATLQIDASSSAFAFVIAIDSSRSMEANDITPSRFEAAKASSLSFLDVIPDGTPIGVISFSGNSYIERAMTSDKVLIRQSINAISFSSTGGTDLNEAVVTSTNMLEKYERKAVILLSDGQINVGTIESAADYAKKNNVIVHTIAIGTSEGGETTYGISKLDEDSLRSLAYNTGGVYSKAESQDALFGSFTKVADVKIGKVSAPLANYFLIAAVALLFFDYILINTKFRPFP